MRSEELIPADDADRLSLHNELHARPTPRVRLPARISYVAVMSKGVSDATVWEHLKSLDVWLDMPESLPAAPFLRVRGKLNGENFVLRWERHSEFNRYTIVQALHTDQPSQDLWSSSVVPPAWLQSIPGQTIAAIELLMLSADISKPIDTVQQARAWFDDRSVVSSSLGVTIDRAAHSLAITDFHICPDGFERMVVYAAAATSETRAGRVAQRLLELETYRMLALKGLPVVKQINPMLSVAEAELSEITRRIEDQAYADQDLLQRLVSLAARIEQSMTEHNYRFAASKAYHNLVKERLGELRERPTYGSQTIGEFLQRRFNPAMATIKASKSRLDGLSERIDRSCDLLRTRVNIAAESQNQELLAKLSRGQAMQLRLQSTVEGLSIAAISYYVVSLLFYAAKALKDLGLAISPELWAGLSIPFVLYGVWKVVQRIHRKIHLDH